MLTPADQKIFQQYKKKFEAALDDLGSSQYVDADERFELTKIRDSLKIKEIYANKIEIEILKKRNPNFAFLTPSFSINVNPEVRTKILANEKLLEDLKIYAMLSNFTDIEILQVFSEGKTSASVFEIKAKRVKSGLLREYYQLLKYDFYPRIYKEFLPSIDPQTEKIFRKNIITTIQNQMPIGVHLQGFLEMEPSYRKEANPEKFFSFKNLIQNNEFYNEILLKNANLRNQVRSCISQVFYLFFKELYKPEILIKEESIQNSLEIFLYPRMIYDVSILPKDSNSKTDKELILSNKDGYEVKPVFSEHKLVPSKSYLFLKILKQRGGRKIRMDGESIVDYDDLISFQRNPLAWDILIKKRAKVTNPRNEMFSQFSSKINLSIEDMEKFELYPIFDTLQKKSDEYDTDFCIETILNKKGKVLVTKNLHTDLNSSNFLLAKIADSVNPTIIDFYDMGESFGNLLYDAARLEADILIVSIERYFQREFPLEKFHGISQINYKAMDLMGIVLNIEEKFFQLKEDEHHVLDKLVLFNIRKIVLKIFNQTCGDLKKKNNLTDRDFNRNYFACLIAFTLKFAGFKQESSLARLIALLLCMRYAHRLESQDKETQAEIPIITDESISLENICKIANQTTKQELGLDLSSKLFVAFYEQTFSEFKNFTSNSKSNESQILFLYGEIGTGKSILLSKFTDNEIENNPILLLNCSRPFVDADGILDLIRYKLQYQDKDTWIDELQDYLKSVNKVICIVIDELYYNPDPDLSEACLKKLISKILNHRIKIIISATPNYWTDHCISIKSNLDPTRVYRALYPNQNDPFSHYYIGIRVSETARKELIEKYLKHYEIIGKPSGVAAKTLTDELWLLRLFCEVKKGNYIGKPEHLHFTDVLETYIGNHHVAIAKKMDRTPTEIYKFFQEISLEMDKASSFEMNYSDFEKISKKKFPNLQVSKIIQYSSNNNYIKYSQSNITFRSFQAVPACLLAEKVTKDWQNYLKKNSMENQWLLEKIKTLKKNQFNELFIYYLLNSINKHLGLAEYKKFFDLLLGYFHEYKIAYPLLRIFGKSISNLPKANSIVMHCIDGIKAASNIYKNKYGDNERKFNQEFNGCLYTINEHLAIDNNAEKFITLFENALEDNKLEQLIKLIGSTKFEKNEWVDLANFMEDDCKRNGNFIRNYMVPALKKIYEKTLHNEKSVISLCDRILKVSRKKEVNYFHTLIEVVYDLLLNLLAIREKIAGEMYKNEVLDVICKYTIRDVVIFRNSATILLNYSLNSENYKYWITFLYKHITLENLSHHSYEALKDAIAEIDFSKIDEETRNTILSPLILEGDGKLTPKINNDYRLQLIKSIIPKLHSKDLKRKKLEEIIQAHSHHASDYREQHVVFLIIKYKDQLLLRFNKNWENYNWVSEQLHESYPTDPKTTEDWEKIKKYTSEQIVEKKLKLEPGTFVVSKIGTPRRDNVQEPFLILSQKDNKLVNYYPILCSLHINKDFVWEYLKGNHDLKLFHTEELVTSINPDISPAVKKVLNTIYKNSNPIWEKIRDVIQLK